MAEDSTSISVIIQDTRNNDCVTLIIDKNDELGSLFTAYAALKETEVKYFHFAIGRMALTPEMTAESLSLKDFDLISCSPAVVLRITNNRGGIDTEVKVKDTTLMSKVFASYAQTMGICDWSKIVFTVDNKKIEPNETVQSLYLQQDAIIVASYCVRQQLFDLCSSRLLSLEAIDHVFVYGGKPNTIGPGICYDFFLAACQNEICNEEIIARLLDHYPSASYYHHHRSGAMPLHYLCKNRNVTIGMVQLLVNSNPESVRHHDNSQKIPLNYLMSHNNNKPDILQFLIDQYPESVRDHPDVIYDFVCCGRSVETCRLILAADPGSEQRVSSSGWMPFHYACKWNNIAMVELLYELYPDAINYAVGAGNQHGNGSTYQHHNINLHSILSNSCWIAAPIWHFDVPTQPLASYHCMSRVPAQLEIQQFIMNLEWQCITKSPSFCLTFTRMPLKKCPRE